MIESVSDAIQLAVLAVCFALALVRALRTRDAAWLELTCFYACMLLGNAYWFGYLVVFGETPYYSYVSDLSWMAGYIFLLMLLIECDQCRGIVAPVRAAWIPVVVCVACCAYYIVESGYPLLNIVDNGLMAALGFFAVRGLAARPEGCCAKAFSHNVAFHVAVLVFVAVEQADWISSTFLNPGPITGFVPYIVTELFLTLSFAVLLVSAWGSERS